MVWSFVTYRVSCSCLVLGFRQDHSCMSGELLQWDRVYSLPVVEKAHCVETIYAINDIAYASLPVVTMTINDHIESVLPPGYIAVNFRPRVVTIYATMVLNIIIHNTCHNGAYNGILCNTYHWFIHLFHYMIIWWILQSTGDRVT